MMTLLVHSLDSMHVCDMLYKLFHFGASGNLYQLCKPHSFLERLCSASTLDCTPLPYTWVACDVIHEQSQVVPIMYMLSRKCHNVHILSAKDPHRTILLMWFSFL